MMPRTLNITTLKKQINDDYNRLKSWSAVAELWSTKGHTDCYIPNKTILNRIAREPDYEPHDHIIRQFFGLAVYQPAPVCPKCGIVHVLKRCPKTQTKHYRSLFDVPPDILKNWFENREEI